MNTTLVVVRAQAHPIDAVNVSAYFQDASDAAKDVDGYLGSQLWRNVAEESRYLLLWHYRDIATAELSLEKIAQRPPLAQREVAEYRPADVTRYRLVGSSKVGPHGLPEADYLSMSVRVADPGYGPELLGELDNIFQELQVLDGYQGSAYAVNDTLAEEVLGLAGWRDPEAFASSLPSGILYDVLLHRRVL